MVFEVHCLIKIFLLATLPRNILGRLRCHLVILSLLGVFKVCPAIELGWDSGRSVGSENTASSSHTPNPDFSARSVQEQTQSACPQFFAQGREPQILNPKLAQNIRLLCFSSFAVGYSPVSRTPLWSAEHLSRDSLYRAKGLKRVNAFHEEERLPSGERSFLSDYAHSGFDRGHMSPSADQPSEQAQQESFSLANMVPQNPNNNRHLWEGIESATRTWAKSAGDLYIITGPLFIGSSVEQLHGRVMVPTHLYKIVYDPARRAASAYLVLNKETDEYSVVSLEELSKIAGIDFVPALNAIQQQEKIQLPKPTPHNGGADSRSSSGLDQGSDSERAPRSREYPDSHSQSGSDFREVEHLLKEIARMIN
jgi:endonuclease G